MPDNKPAAQGPASGSPPATVPPAPEGTLAPPPPEPPSALDKKAQALADKAADEQAKADDVAARAQAAAEAAEDEDVPGKVQRCPHCRTPLEKHGDTNPHKAGCSHCNGCGCCFAPGLRHVRAGTSACAQAVKSGG